MSASGWGLSALWFFVIIAMIPMALWLLKRTPLAAGAQGQLARVISSTPLGPQQRLVMVEMGTGESRQWLLLGVTAHSITSLQTLPAQSLAPVASPEPVSASFSGLLQKARQLRGMR